MKHVHDQLPAYLLTSASEILLQVAILLAVTIGPFVVFAVIIHWLEQTIQSRLAGRFGWKSVLWTGWLGTPIHELSHALMCKLFRHRIDELVLFEPDRESGRLGYVRHSYRKGNWFEEIGNVFIGLAPLIGGSVVLAGLLWVFYPVTAEAAIQAGRSQESGVVSQTFSIVTAICGGILEGSNLGTIRFWAFIYLVLCVGSHMAPSGSDYRGAGKGALILATSVFLLAAVAAMIVPDLRAVSLALTEILSPLFAVLALTVVLCSLATIIVSLITAFMPRIFG